MVRAFQDEEFRIRDTGPGSQKVNIRHFYFPEVLLRLGLRVLGQKERENVLLDNFVVDSSKADKLLTEINMGRR